jgi:hypothetical protein
MSIIDVPIGTQQSLKVYIKTASDSVPIVKSVLDGIIISESVKNKATCEFSVVTSSKNEYEIGNFVKLMDYTTVGNEFNLFIGIAVDIKVRPLVIGGELIATISCVDLSIIYDNILIAETYENMTLRDIAYDILSKYTINEYINWLRTPAFATDLIIKAVFNYISISDAFNYLCDELAVNFKIGIDAYDGYAHFFYRDQSTTLDIDKSNIFDIEVSKTLETYRNQQYVKAGYDTTDLQSREILTPKPDGASKAFFTRYPIAKVPTILIDNTTVSAVSVGIEGVDTDKLFYWSKGSTQINHNTAVGTTLTSAKTLSMTYYGLIRILIQADNVEGQDECKTNMYDTQGIFSNIVEVSAIEERAEAIAYANGLLYKYNKMPESITIKTNCFRQVGELVQVNYPEILDDDLYFIEAMDIDYYAKTFWYSYKILNGESLGNWTEFFRTIEKKSSDMLINEDVQLIKLQQQAEFYDVCSEYDIVVGLDAGWYLDTTFILDIATLGILMSSSIEYDT